MAALAAMAVTAAMDTVAMDMAAMDTVTTPTATMVIRKITLSRDNDNYYLSGHFHLILLYAHSMQ
jgi:hypothetical protein